MNRLSLVSTAVLVLAGTACTDTYVVKPATGGRDATARSAGLGLVATPNAWNADPDDLPEFVTPIWVNLENRRPEELRVNYADLVLTDDSGFRYAAISPYTGQPSPSTTAPSSPPSTPARPQSMDQPTETQQLELAQLVNLTSTPTRPQSMDQPTESQQLELAQLANRAQSMDLQLDVDGDGTHWFGQGLATRELELASELRLDTAADASSEPILARAGRGGRAGGGFHGGGGGIHGGAFHGGYHGARGHWSPGWSGGVYVGPRFYGHDHYYYRPWPYFYYGFWGPTYWGPYVYYWDYRYYPSEPSDDVLRYGLPEGVIKPGGRVAGYVYFQNAATRAKRLDLTWNAHTVAGAAVGTVEVDLLVVRD